MKRLLRQILLPAVLAAAAMALVAAGPASAAGWKQILRDCVYNEGLKGKYTRAELNNAKRHITGERIAYTECTSEIQAALSRLGGKGKGKSGGKGAYGVSDDLDGDGVVTKAERKRAAKIRAQRERDAIAAANDALESDSASGGPGGGSSGGGGLPLILAVAGLTLAATGGGTWYAARRNPAIANALRRVPPLGRRG